MAVRPIWRLYCDTHKCTVKFKRVYVTPEKAIEVGVKDGWQVTDAGVVSCPFHAGNGERRDGVMGGYVKKYGMPANYAPVKQPDMIPDIGPPPF